MNMILRLAAGGALVSCIFALNSRDAHGLNDPTINQLQMSGTGCSVNSVGNYVTLEAHGFNAAGQDVCEVSAILSSGSTVSTTCPSDLINGVVGHKAYINERSTSDWRVVNNYKQSPSMAVWPTTTVTTTNGPITASVAGPGCGTVQATSIGYKRP